MSVGERIKEYRKKKDLTQQELGALCGGIAAATIGRYERGDLSPKFQTVAKLARALECEVGELYQDETALHVPGWSESSSRVAAFMEEVDNQRIDSFTDFLNMYNIFIYEPGVVTFDGAAYTLSFEQLEQLPDMSIEQIKGLVRSLAKKSERNE